MAELFDVGPVELVDVAPDTQGPGLTDVYEPTSEVREDISDEPPFWKQLAYVWDEDSHNWVTNFAAWMDSKFPTPTITLSKENTGLPVVLPFYGVGRLNISWPEDKYGEGWESLSSEERRQILMAKEAERLAKEHPDIHGPEAISTKARVLGELANIAQDPSTALPIGGAKLNLFKAGAEWFTKQTVAEMGKLAAAGSAVAAVDELLYQAARESDMNYWEVGKMGIAGAVLTPVLTVAATKAATKLISTPIEKEIKKAQAAQLQGQEELLEAFQEGILKKIAAGENRIEAVNNTITDLGLTDAVQIRAAMDASEKGIYLPKTPAQAMMILEDAQPVGNRTFKEGGLIDYLIEPVSSRIKKLSEPIFLRTMDYARKTHELTHKTLQPARELLFKEVNKLSDEHQQLFHKAWQNMDYDTINRIFLKNENARQGMEFIRKTYDDLYEKLKPFYPDMKKIDGYLSRHIHDKKGLLNEMGKPFVEGYHKRLNEKTKQLGRALTELEETDLLNSYMRSNQARTQTLEAAKERKFEQVPSKFLPFYATPEQTFSIYVARAITDIEKRKFFGKYAKKGKHFNEVDIDASIGELLKDQNLDYRELDELRKLLVARFQLGEAAPRKIIQSLRNFSYLATIANLVSTITQVADLFYLPIKYGVKNALKGIFGEKVLDAQVDFGFSVATTEMSESTLRSAKLLDKSLELTQFKRLDRFAKTSDLNAAWSMYTSLADPKSGNISKIAEKYGKAYGDDFALLVDDLQNKRITDRTKTLLWTELARTQPIDKAEMPLGYLNHPDGRLWYTLTSYTLKSLDFARKEIWRDKFAKGKIAEGTVLLATTAFWLAYANVSTQSIKNYVMGKEFGIDDLPMMAVAGLWKNFGGSEIVIRNITDSESLQEAAKKAIAATADVAQVSVPILDAVVTAGKDLMTLMEEEDYSYSDSPKTYKSIRYFPWAGPMLYNFFGGGLEKYNEQREKQKEKKYNY